MSENRIVHVRTSASAQDFWSRPRDERRYAGTSFRVAAEEKTTPYSIQRPPFSPIPPHTPTTGHVQDRQSQSRIIERRVLIKDIKDNETLAGENAKLRKEVERLELQVKRVLSINYTLSKEMVNMYNQGDM